MAIAQNGDPLKKVKDSLNFKNKAVEKIKGVATQVAQNLRHGLGQAPEYVQYRQETKTYWKADAKNRRIGRIEERKEKEEIRQRERGKRKKIKAQFKMWKAK